VTRITELPPSARRTLIAVLLAGSACVAAALTGAGGWTGQDLMALAGLALAGAVLEQFLLPMRHGTERQFFSVTDAVWMAGLLLARPSVLIVAVAVGVAAGQAARRVAPHKVAFNVAQYALSIAVAEGIFRAGHPLGVESRSWMLGIVAMAAYFAVNAGTVALMIAKVVRRPFWQVLTEPLRLTAVQWGGNMAVGVLGALVWSNQHLAVLLVMVPLAALHVAYRNYAHTRGLPLAA
jgi:hypothetical protein